MIPVARHLILIGLPGVGKSTAGQEAANRLGQSFYDFDTEIEQMFGASVPDIFSRLGERVFREAEVQVSQRFADPAVPSAILAPGGGWAANAPAVAHLRAASRIIYLRATPLEALRRLGEAIAHRPLFAAGKPQDVMERLLEERRHTYESVADYTIDTDGLSRIEVADQIVQLGSLPTFRRDI